VARPRSEATRRAILGAALELIETDGYARLTMEGIAKRAEVSKQTIYRWWPSPAAVLMEALNERAQTLVPGRDLGSFEPNVRAFVRRTVAALHGGLAPLVAHLMAEAQRDPEFAATFGERFLARRRDALHALFIQARTRGEIGADIDSRLLVEIAFGTIWYRVLARHAPLNRRFADQLSDALLVLATSQAPQLTASGVRPRADAPAGGVSAR
jgi:AcrR family transcriptional regulator